MIPSNFVTVMHDEENTVIFSLEFVKDMKVVKDEIIFLHMSRTVNLYEIEGNFSTFGEL